MYILKRAIIIMGLMLIYKWIGHSIGIMKGFNNYEFDYEYAQYYKDKEVSRENKIKMFYLIFKDYPILFEIIF